MKYKRNRANPFPVPDKKRVSKLGWRKSLGKIGEDHTADFLCRKGWKIIERNWRAGRYAEIDIIALDPQKILVFIEVKTRIKTDNPTGFISAGFDKIDQKKINKMVAVSRLYMAKCLRFGPLDQGCRFDAFVLFYPASIRQAEWENFNTLPQLSSVKPEILHVKDLLA